MARTNLHTLANSLLEGLSNAADGTAFEGRLREISTEAGLNSVRSAEAVKLLEETGRIEVIQRGRRGRNTMITITSTEPLTIEDAEARLPSRGGKRTGRINYDDIGGAVVDRLLALARDDGLRTAQVEAFAAASEQQSRRVEELEAAVEGATQRETELRIKLRTAEEALKRAEENLRRALGGDRPSGAPRTPIEDDDARAVLDILRSGHD
ncbi:MAG: hypothetical protein GEU71_08650 [Actinobacteria bacterium]|nr:hypothetical protein [Actinomycetota bacterium]